MNNPIPTENGADKIIRTSKGNTVTLEYVLNCAEFIIMRLK